MLTIASVKDLKIRFVKDLACKPPDAKMSAIGTFFGFVLFFS